MWVLFFLSITHSFKINPNTPLHLGRICTFSLFWVLTGRRPVLPACSGQGWTARAPTLWKWDLPEQMGFLYSVLGITVDSVLGDLGIFKNVYYTKTILRNFRAKKQMEIRGRWVVTGRLSVKARWHFQSLRTFRNSTDV